MRFNADLDAPIVKPHYAPRNALPIPSVSISSEPSVTMKCNVRWFSHLTGILEALDQPDAWVGTESQIEDARAEIRKLIASVDEVIPEMNSLPLGFVIPSATLSAAIPDWLLLCDGATHDRVDYPDLYDVLESAFILDDDTFKVPNLNEKFPLGATSSIGSEGGAATHTLTISEMPQHNHPRNTATIGEYVLTVLTGFPGSLGLRNYNTTPNVPIYLMNDTGNKGGGAAHNNMPPHQKLRYFIVAKP